MPVAPLAVRRALRLVLVAMIRLVYRIELRSGALPDHGPALIAANHTAYVDPFVLTACCPVPIRFVYWHALDRIPLVGAFCRFCGGIPIAGALEQRALFDRAMSEIDAALSAGEVVAIFPEGGLTRDGALGPFKRGIERIVAARPVPVVPVAIDGLWGSVFSRASPKRPRSVRPQVRLRAGDPLAPHAVSADDLRERVTRLGAGLATS
jgi:1-acyl-sn-glycerol-3-phosphate acyltransferase